MSFEPTAAMKQEAERGLAWRREFGRGGTSVGLARARDISNGAALSMSTVNRMVSFFARHEVDKKAEGFRQGEKGYPSNGRIAWALWGGDAGKQWANAIAKREAKDMAKIIEDGEEIEVELMAVDAAILDGINRHEVIDAEAVSFRETSEGYLTFEANFARTGIQDYLASEVGLTGDSIVRVYRPETSVFDASSVATFSTRPITLGHPPVLVTPDNSKKYTVGMTGTKIKRNGNMVRGSGIITDRDAIDAVKNGKARQLSMGYTLKIDHTSGVTPDGEAYDAIQTDLRMNHLAIVPRARGGDKLKIGDRKETDMTDKTTTIVVDGVAVKVLDGADALTKAIADHEATKAKLATVQADSMSSEEANKKRIAELEAKIADMEKAKATDADIDALVDARAKLLADAAKIAPAFDAKGKSADDIRKGVVAAIAGDDAVADKSADYIAARFDALLLAGDKDPFASPLKKSASDAQSGGWGKSVFDAAGVKMKG